MNSTEMVNSEINPVMPFKSAEKQNIDDEEGVYFSAYEWYVFKEEQKSGKDIKTTVNNARYYGELKKRIDDIEVGRNTVTFTEEEFEEMINTNDIP